MYDDDGAAALGDWIQTNTMLQGLVLCNTNDLDDVSAAPSSPTAATSECPHNRLTVVPSSLRELAYLEARQHIFRITLVAMDDGIIALEGPLRRLEHDGK